MFGIQDINRHGGQGTEQGVKDGVRGPIFVPHGDPKDTTFANSQVWEKLEFYHSSVGSIWDLFPNQ